MTKKDEGILPTHAYTYEVKMIVQILAEDEKSARRLMVKVAMSPQEK